ncbi:maleylpyruvate isomerase N-terminal domain-containing protein [Marmoricola sp. URHB0036]|uniref:maleylpyruvate isomerase N-terminal domain-containing protein n=1 Tax=Marmoricola sp. URHB0036 TaxID=1298863 RepID=UPI0004835A76|nr:maleylpyruvate isomerase N-terminal domain-containing protein [Marmoricola sp. URHB0036]
MPSSWDDARLAYAEASACFVDTAALVGDRWEEPGLGEWDVRALVGHTSRSFVTVESYLAQPAKAVAVGSTADYYRATREMAATGAGVAERGREAGRALGQDPLSSVSALATRVLELVGTTDGTELLTTIAGGMRLSDYLPTRTFELVVHTLDLGRAIDVAVDVPALPAATVLGLVSELAIGDGLAGPLVLAATGRGGLPDGFTVL